MIIFVKGFLDEVKTRSPFAELHAIKIAKREHTRNFVPLQLIDWNTYNETFLVRRHFFNQAEQGFDLGASTSSPVGEFFREKTRIAAHLADTNELAKDLAFLLSLRGNFILHECIARFVVESVIQLFMDRAASERNFVNKYRLARDLRVHVAFGPTKFWKNKLIDD